MSTLGEKIEANANLTLWCVHIIGPDDVLAAPSHDAAVVHAHELNKTLHRRLGTPNDIMCFAYAAPWPHGVEAHAESVKEWPENAGKPQAAPPVYSIPEGALDQLRNHQQQLDQDGVFVGVSRQALDEVLAAMLQAASSPERED